MIEFERSAPIIVGRPLFRELAKAAVKRTVTELKERVAQREQERKANRQHAGGAQTDPLAEAHREEQRQLRDLGEQAHGVNLDIGRGLLDGLALVDPSDMDVVIWGRFSRVIDVKERPLDRLVGGVICGCC